MLSKSHIFFRIEYIKNTSLIVNYKVNVKMRYMNYNVVLLVTNLYIIFGSTLCL